jgi:hypothetical protein
LTESGTINPWIEFFKQLLDQPVSQNLGEQTGNMEEIAIRDKSV